MFKWIIRIVGIVLLLIILALVAVAIFVNPNDYKQQIQSKLSQTLHRQVELNGKLSLTIFPNLGVRIEKVDVINPKGYAINSFASVGEADVSVNLLPLIGGEFSVNHITLKDAKFNLIQTASGSNWQFGKEKVSYSSKAAKEYSKVTHKKPQSVQIIPQIPAFNIGNLSIQSSTVNYYDQVKKTSTTLNLTSFTGSDITSGSRFPISLKATVKQASQTIKINLDTKVKFSETEQSFALSKMSLVSSITKTKQPPMTFTVNGDANININKQVAAVDLKEATFAGTKVSGKVDITNLLSTMKYKGNLVVTAPSYAGLKPLTGALPKNINDFAPLKSSFAFNGDNNNANLKSLKVDAGKFTARGYLNIANFKSPSIKGALNTSTLDLDKLMSNSPAAASKSSVKTAAHSSSSHAPTSYSKKAVLPLALLAKLKLDNTITMTGLVYNGQLLNKPTLSIKASHGVLTIATNKVGLGKGSMSFNTTVDAKRPTISIKVNADNIDAIQLQKLFGQAKNVASGTGHVDMTIRMTGNSAYSWVHSMNGQIDFALNKGIFYGVDLNYWVAAGNALLNKTKNTTNDTKQTAFDTLRATLLINKGVISNNNLLMSSVHLKTTGNGTINLPAKQVNYHVSARFQDLNAKGKVITIPVIIQGNLSKPKIAPDVGAIIKAEAQRAIKREASNFFKNLADKFGKH